MRQELIMATSRKQQRYQFNISFQFSSSLVLVLDFFAEISAQIQHNEHKRQHIRDSARIPLFEIKGRDEQAKFRPKLIAPI